jgi:hypothetical protein
MLECRGSCGCGGTCEGRVPDASVYHAPDSSAYHAPRPRTPPQVAPGSESSDTGGTASGPGSVGSSPYVTGVPTGDPWGPILNAVNPVTARSDIMVLAVPHAGAALPGILFQEVNVARRRKERKIWECQLAIIPFNCRRGTCRSTPSVMRSDPCGIRWKGRRCEFRVAYTSEVTQPSRGIYYVEEVTTHWNPKRIRKGSIPCAPPTKPKPPHANCFVAFDVATVPRREPIPADLFAGLRPYSDVESVRVRLVCTPYNGQSCSNAITVPIWDGDMVVEAYQRARSIALGFSDLDWWRNSGQWEDEPRPRSLQSKLTVRTWLLDFAIRGASSLFDHYLLSATREPRVFQDHDWTAAMSAILAETTLAGFQKWAVPELHRGKGDLSKPVDFRLKEAMRKEALSEAWLRFFNLGDVDLEELVAVPGGTVKKRMELMGKAFGEAHLEEPIALLVKARPPGPCAVDDMLQLWRVIRNAQAEALDDLWRFVPSLPFVGWFRDTMMKRFRDDWFESMARALDKAGRPDLGKELRRRKPQ